MNLIEIIIREMETDSCDLERQSDYLKCAYEKASQPKKEAMDETLICLCGWSIETLLQMEERGR